LLRELPDDEWIDESPFLRRVPVFSRLPYYNHKQVFGPPETTGQVETFDPLRAVRFLHDTRPVCTGSLGRQLFPLLKAGEVNSLVEPPVWRYKGVEGLGFRQREWLGNEMDGQDEGDKEPVLYDVYL
jgi:hypothetical protein